ncbi:MAG: galactokinase [Actinobacteria bacterium]|nr:MAG: galactokinase [Actinomycetota bacterium]
MDLQKCHTRVRLCDCLMRELVRVTFPILAQVTALKQPEVQSGRKVVDMRNGTEIGIFARSPGRVNLIGDHTDYTGGMVLPMAINRFTTITAQVTPQTIRLTSADQPDVLDIRLPIADPSSTLPLWGRYVAGVASEMQIANGFTGSVSTTLPLGGGLSSSAALELATALMLSVANDQPISSPLELAQLCRRAEHAATGVPCGIMDQLTCASGVAGHALLIDCHSLQVSPILIPHDVHIYVQFVAHRQLASSAYVDRVAQCKQAEREIGPLRLADSASTRAIDDEVLRRRALHVVSENERVRRATVALASQDLATFGQLMNESHDSLRNDFEVSTPQMDAAVETARKVPGVFGARMTGGGFGGCIVIVADSTVDVKKFDHAMLVQPVDGASVNS